MNVTWPVDLVHCPNRVATGVAFLGKQLKTQNYLK